MVLSREPERKVSSAGFMQRVTTLYRIIIPGHLTLPGIAGGSFGAGRELGQGAGEDRDNRYAHPLRESQSLEGRGGMGKKKTMKDI
jgi:hypothetical protein